MQVSRRLTRANNRKDHQQRKQHQRFDQREAENHHRLNTTSGSRVTSCAFTSGRANARLSDRSTEHCDRETDTSGERAVLGPGDWIAVPRGVPHTATVVGDEPVVSLDAVKSR